MITMLIGHIFDFYHVLYSVHGTWDRIPRDLFGNKYYVMDTAFSLGP